MLVSQLMPQTGVSRELLQLGPWDEESFSGNTEYTLSANGSGTELTAKLNMRDLQLS